MENEISHYYPQTRVKSEDAKNDYDFRFAIALQKLPNYKQTQRFFVALVGSWLFRNKSVILSKWQIRNARYGKARNPLVLEALENIVFEQE
jgi:hypothetical protein